MTYCSECGSKLMEGAKFCPDCGMKILRKNNENGKIRRDSFEGDIRKCPNCGEILKAFQGRCELCGFELRNVSTSKAVKNFANELDRLYSKRKSSGFMGIIGNVIGTNNNHSIDEQINNLIRSYTIPNSKEDILEFMILAASNINYDVMNATKPSDIEEVSVDALRMRKNINEAWMIKFDQAYQKAQLIMDGDDLIKVEELHNKYQLRAKKKNMNHKDSSNKSTLIVLLCTIIIPMALLFGYYYMEEVKLDMTVKQIEKDIENGQYESALIKANTLHGDGDFSDESVEKWDKTREEIIKIIEEKMKEEGK